MFFLLIISSDMCLWLKFTLLWFEFIFADQKGHDWGKHFLLRKFCPKGPSILQNCFLSQILLNCHAKTLVKDYPLIVNYHVLFYTRADIPSTFWKFFVCASILSLSSAVVHILLTRSCPWGPTQVAGDRSEDVSKKRKKSSQEETIRTSSQNAPI